MACITGDQPAVIEFLNQLTDGDQVVVRVRGLPYTVTKKQIVSPHLNFTIAVPIDFSKR